MISVSTSVPSPPPKFPDLFATPTQPPSSTPSTHQETLDRVTEQEQLLLLALEKIEDQADEVHALRVKMLCSALKYTLSLQVGIARKAVKNRDQRLQESSMVVKMRDAHIKKLKGAAKGEISADELAQVAVVASIS